MTKSLTVKGCLLVACLLLVSGMSAGPKLQRFFVTFNAANGLADNSAQTINCTRTGRMVISTIGHINFYDGESFNHIDPSPEDLFPLPEYKGHYHQYFDKFHHLWLKDKQSVTCLDLLTERFVSNVDSVMKSLGMTRRVDDLFGDFSSGLWLMTGQALYSADRKKEYPVRMGGDLHDVDVYDDKVLLQFFGTGMVVGYDLASGHRLFDVPSTELDEEIGKVYSSVICPDSNIYYQIRNGEKEAMLLSFDVSTRQWKRLLHTPYHLNNMVLERGKLYIASEYGYWTYDIKTGATEHHEELMLVGGRKLRTDINVICFDRQGSMWLGTEMRGLLYSPRYKSPFVSYTWDDPEAQQYGRMMYDAAMSGEHMPLPRHVNCRYRDSRGWVWSGTYKGLELQQSADAPVRTYTCKDGLLNEMVHSVIEDDNHDIWISTSFGISHLFIRDDSVYHMESYSQKDNVPGESFANDRAMKLEDGTIVMQALDHVVVFHPSNFYEEELEEMVLFPKLVRLMVNGHIIEPGTKLDGRVILDRTIARIREFTVDYNQNMLTLVFSGLNYLRPVQTYYRVRVKGVYDEWRVVSHQDADGLVDDKGMLHLPLTALPPGRYEVEVQASMSPENWPLHPFTWVVYVEQPWWRTTGVYLLLALLVVGAMVANLYYFYRNTSLRMQRDTLEDNVVKRIRAFVRSSERLTAEGLGSFDMTADEEQGPNERLDNDFADAILKMIPYLREHQDRRISMAELTAVTGVDAASLYKMLSANLYKGPRQMIKRIKLEEAARMLTGTDKEVEQIADELGFASPNYFIATFYHHYRQTPADYRKSMAR